MCIEIIFLAVDTKNTIIEQDWLYEENIVYALLSLIFQIRSSKIFFD